MTKSYFTSNQNGDARHRGWEPGHLEVSRPETPLRMFLLCRGVGWEPPLQKLKKGGVEIGGTRLEAKQGCKEGVEGGRRRALCYMTV